MVNARTIMTENVITVSENSTVVEASRLIINKKVNALLVTRGHKPIAIVTQQDLVKGSINKNPSKVKVKSIMSKDFLVVDPNESYSNLNERVRQGKISRFPVVENGKLVGIVTETDLIQTTRDFTRFHQLMQEVILAIFGIVTAFFLFFFSPLGQSIFVG
jgi:CBS domain-containing protein